MSIIKRSSESPSKISKIDKIKFHCDKCDIDEDVILEGDDKNMEIKCKKCNDNMKKVEK